MYENINRSTICIYCNYLLELRHKILKKKNVCHRLIVSEENVFANGSLVEVWRSMDTLHPVLLFYVRLVKINPYQQVQLKICMCITVMNLLTEQVVKILSKISYMNECKHTEKYIHFYIH